MLQLHMIAAERVTELHRQLAERDAELQRLADTDTLTGLANRRRARLQLESLHRLAKRKRQRLAVALLDIEHFKQVNDTFGHDAGDQVLYEFATVLQASFRAEDVVARWGGDEFLVGMYGIDNETLANRLRHVLWEQIASDAHTTGRVTFSGGVAEFPGDGSDLMTLCRVADMALYNAKARGRRRHSIWSTSVWCCTCGRIPLRFCSHGGHDAAWRLGGGRMRRLSFAAV